MNNFDNLFEDPSNIEEIDVWNKAEARGYEIQKKLISLPLYTGNEVQNLIEGFHDLGSLKILRSDSKIFAIPVIGFDGLEDGYYYPRWQFVDNSKIVPGLSDVLQEFKGYSQWEIYAWLVSKNARIPNNLSPSEFLILAYKGPISERENLVNIVISAAIS
jgi:hypothetical protein